MSIRDYLRYAARQSRYEYIWLVKCASGVRAYRDEGNVPAGAIGKYSADTMSVRDVYNCMVEDCVSEGVLRCE